MTAQLQPTSLRPTPSDADDSSARLLGLELAFYFASRGAGRMVWPLVANVVRFVIVAGGAWTGRTTARAAAIT